MNHLGPSAWKMCKVKYYCPNLFARDKFFLDLVCVPKIEPILADNDVRDRYHQNSVNTPDAPQPYVPTYCYGEG